MHQINRIVRFASISALLVASLMAAHVAQAQDESNYPSFEALGLELYVIQTRIEVSREQMLEVLPQHIEFIKTLENEGRLFAAGPLSDWTDEPIRGNGLILIRANSFEQANEIAKQDPMHSSGARSYSIQRWTLNEGNLQLEIRLSTGRTDVY